MMSLMEISTQETSTTSLQASVTSTHPLLDLTCSNSMDLERQLNYANRKNMPKLLKYSDNMLKITQMRILET